ncbi:SLAM family member 8-like isoform X1 [Tachysurus fulvidraco]|uniref:SLAM family member 8-like isoform X1 n=1 Tax=Tachysurus fulvidraco TaxID=1234273 RepID=UPI001FEF1664|nr:SLAM family member 8-like isoform X1 [Tachysurus fulvidraco]
MADFHGYHVSILGALMLGILQGLFVLADTDTEKVLKTGSSLDLTVTYPNDSIVSWEFNGKKFAEYSLSRSYSFKGVQFSGRLKSAHDVIGVTLQDLQPQDSGTFTILAIVSGKQTPTQSIKISIQNPIRAVQIEKTQRWLLPTNSCDVDVKCAALGAENVSYQWSGYKTASEAHLQFRLSPAEGAVTLNCTATNKVSSSFATETLSCSSETEVSLPVLKLISSLVAASPYLLVTIILAVKCYTARGHHNSQNAVAVIEE